MEKTCTAAIRVFFLVASLMLCGIRADGETKKVTDPRGNVNLSPFEQWFSIAECLQNTSTSCSQNFTLTISGRINVTSTDGEEFCKVGGCKEHTSFVLDCVHDVKQDMKFGNGATVKDLNCTINHGCTYGFNGTTLISGGGN